MPHSGESLSMLGTLRGEGATTKRDNALYVLADGGEVLTDELGNTLFDEAVGTLTE